MNALMTVLLAMVSRPYVAVSKPTVQAWARLTRGYWRWQLRRHGLAPMAGGAQEKGDPPAVVVGAIPETSEELAECVADPKRREAIFGDDELTKEFLAKYARAVNKADPDLPKTISDEVQKGLKTFMEEAGIERPNLNLEIKPLPEKGSAYNKHAIGAKLDKEFENTSEFLQSIWHQNLGGADKWKQIRADYSTIDPATGGFLVPEVLRAELLKVALETSIVRPRARVIPMDAKSVGFPTIDATSNASSVYGGVIGYWTEEGGALAETEAKFGTVQLQASKLTTRCDVPNELLQDSIISFAAFIDQILPEAIAWFEDTAFMNGSGVGQPLGVMLSPALESVAKEAGQDADTIVFENIVNMYSRMLPASLNSAVWIANNDCFPELATMSLSVGTGGSAI